MFLKHRVMPGKPHPVIESNQLRKILHGLLSTAEKGTKTISVDTIHKERNNLIWTNPYVCVCTRVHVLCNDPTIYGQVKYVGRPMCMCVCALGCDVVEDCVLIFTPL